MDTEPVKLAIVGCGAITRMAHLPALLCSAKLDLSALIDSSHESAEGLAADFGLRCRLATNLSDVLDEAEGVVIATPNHTHHSLALAALERGKPVFVEKPLTTTYSDAEHLVRVAEQNRSWIAVGYTSRHFPSVRLLKDLLTTGYVGSVRSFYFEAGSSGGWDPVSGYSLHRGQSGGGVLVVKGSHFLDRMLYWFGEPASVEFQDDSHGGVEANCRGEMTFDNELGSFRGRFFLSKTINLRNTLFVDCSEHLVILPEADTLNVTLRPKTRPDLKLKVSTDGPPGSGEKGTYFRVQLEEFADRIRGARADVTVDGRFAARSVRLIERLYELRRTLPEPWLLYRKDTPASHVQT